MPFSNPIVAGEDLVRTGIRSPNYVTGSTGWRIAQDGSAEFNSLTVVGAALIGGSVTLDQAGDGLFVYSGAPAAGNLLIALTPTAGTDAYGNAYSAGLTFGSSAQQHITMHQAGDGLFVYNGNPGAGRLLLSISPTAGADAYGNSYPSGIGMGGKITLDPSVPKIVVNNNSNDTIEVNPTGSSVPTIYFRNHNGQYGWLNSVTAGVMEMSSDASGTYRSRALVETNDVALQCIQIAGGTLVSGLGAQVASPIAYAFPALYVLGAGGAGSGPVNCSTVTADSISCVKPFSIVGTTNGSGDFNLGNAIATAFGWTTLLGASVWNGDGVARANIVISKSTGAGTYGTSWNVRVTQGNTGAAVAGVAVRFDGIATGHP